MTKTLTPSQMEDAALIQPTVTTVTGENTVSLSLTPKGKVWKINGKRVGASLAHAVLFRAMSGMTTDMSKVLP